MPRSPQRQFRYRLMAARGCGSVSQSPEHAFRPHARRAPHHESAEYVDRGRSREVTRGVTTLHPKQSGEVVVTSSNGGMIFAESISFCRRQSQLSPWFAGERLPQRCQPVERGSRQRAFLDRGDCGVAIPTRMVPIAGCESANRMAASARLAANPSLTSGIRRWARATSAS